MVDEPKLDRIAGVIEHHWPAEIHSSELQSPTLVSTVETARAALFDALGLAELI
jgi:succinylarginine dihydrolase